MFSANLEEKLKGGKVQTVGDLQRAFGEKSFAILFLLFMFIPSLPIPTGGITHVFLLPVVWIASMELTFGRRTLWFPWFITRIKLGDSILKKGLPFMIRRIKWFERFSRPRLRNYMNSTGIRTLSGIFIFLFALAAFVSPPFSGLDTLPSVGAVLVALALILEDMVLYVLGLAIGTFGIGIIIATAGAISAFVHHYF
jgi:hypothetical protein